MCEEHNLPRVVIEPFVCKFVKSIDWTRYENLVLRKREFLYELEMPVKENNNGN